MYILAAIVTHNRCELLTRCVDHIRMQTRPPDALVVINNGSTDDTEVMLAERCVEVVSQANLGSAGGWQRAISEALIRNADAVWLMDDDGYPDAAALALLEQALQPGLSCASSIVVQEHRPDRFVFPFPVLDSNGLPVLFGWPRKLPLLKDLQRLAPGGSYPFAHFFNGALVNTSAIRQVGNVNDRFFIFGDEVDFFFRLRKVGQVVSVLKARHFHPDVSGRPYSADKIFYFIRNTMILNRRYFNLVLFRDVLALFVVFYRVSSRNGLGVALSYLIGKRLPVSIQAISDGLHGLLGRTFHG